MQFDRTFDVTKDPLDLEEPTRILSNCRWFENGLRGHARCNHKLLNTIKCELFGGEFTLIINGK